jgi:hypothetical protein
MELTDTTTVRVRGSLRRQIEQELLTVSYDVAPLMTDTERVAFLDLMMRELTMEEAQAIAAELRTNDN